MDTVFLSAVKSMDLPPEMWRADCTGKMEQRCEC
jgi:hypothetical protein